MKTIKERLLERCTKKENGCWEWTTGKFSDGYGAIKISRKTKKAHRVSYEEFIGQIPEGLCVLHTCDNPACINPAHLWLGTHASNMADRNTKNRQANGDRNGSRLHPEKRTRGEQFPQSKLTTAEVIEIRQARENNGTTYLQLARKFNVSESLIWSILTRRSWKHV